jgi:mannose PTS system EIIA component
VIGIVVVAHGPLANALVDTTEFIIGSRLEAIKALEVTPDGSPKELKSALVAALAQVDDGDGVLVLVDMFGGSPSDMSISFLEPGRIEVLTGANLPMLLEVALRRNKTTDVKELAEEGVKKALSSIATAGSILNP